MKAADATVLARRVRDRVRRDGVLMTAKRGAYRASERWDDWRLGIRTSGYVPLPELGLDDQAREFRNDYSPIERGTFNRITRALGVGNDENVFIDYGSGMGRAVVLAATFPYRRVIGVELSPELNAIAQDNVRRARPKLTCQDIELVTADAVGYAVEPDVTVFLLHNPFVGEVLEAVLNNIRRSLVDAPRSAVVVHGPPQGEQESLLDRCDWLKKDMLFRSGLGREIRVYRSALPSR